MRHLPTCTAYRHGGEGIHRALTVGMGRGGGMCRYCSPIVGKRMEREGPIYTQEVFKVPYTHKRFSKFRCIARMQHCVSTV